MARKRGFDLDDALDQMVEVFWRKGYAATSINDLEEATNLNRTSLYAAIGGKEAIFLQALRRYAVKYNEHLMSALRDNPSATAALTDYFDRQIDQIVDYRLPGGCLLANSVVECRQSNETVEHHVSTEFRRIEAAFVATIRRGQKSGEIDNGIDAEKIARLLTATAEGMTLLARSKYPKGALRDVAAGALSLLGITFSAAPAATFDRH
jgi:TetR/AcrR family transcriptional regulator, transcriptional repressor for nem operon